MIDHVNRIALKCEPITLYIYVNLYSSQEAIAMPPVHHHPARRVAGMAQAILILDRNTTQTVPTVGTLPLQTLAKCILTTRTTQTTTQTTVQTTAHTRKETIARAGRKQRSVCRHSRPLWWERRKESPYRR